jgi:hypothetical protein
MTVEAAATELIHAYGQTGGDRIDSMIEHSIDNGIVMAGFTDLGAGSASFLLIKTDSVGTEMWTKTYSASVYDTAYCVIEHSIDNGFVLAGRTSSWGAGSWDIMLVKTDSVGVEMWTKTFGGTSSDYGEFVVEHSIDNGFAVTGRTRFRRYR